MSDTKVIATSANSPKCPECGTLLPTGALSGLCPACLLKQGAAADTVTDGKQPPFNPPPVAELAPLFPQLEILELIGKGGMGAVYKARQKQLDRVVALKILPPGIGTDPAFAERFSREAKALAKLNHPGIVTLFEFGSSGCETTQTASDTEKEKGGEGAEGSTERVVSLSPPPPFPPAASLPQSTRKEPSYRLYFFLMEFVDGVNLRQLLHAGRVSPREALAIVPQICEALQFAHDQGIVHRDIKPENILLDRRGRVKVADFGLAKLVGTDAPISPSLSPSDGERVAKLGEGSPVLTDAGKVMGTPQYMAPEQRDYPGEVDHRADIYALGVVFYQMLTGELPGKPLQPPSKKVQIDVRLDEVVLRALEKKPELRYQQASVLKTQVETIATTPPTGSSGYESAQTEAVEVREDHSRLTSAATSGEARFSRTAIVGAGCLAITVLAGAVALTASSQSIALALQTPNLPWPLPQQFLDQGRTVFLVAILSQGFGAICALAGTTLGWIAVFQIRHSPGKLQGLWLAVFDGLLFPLLALDGLVFWMWRLVGNVAGQVMVWEFDLTPSGVTSLMWLLAAVTSVVVDLVVIRRVWRAVNPPALDAPTHPLPPVDCPVPMERWLALLDDGDYAQSWQTAAPTLQRKANQADWAAQLEVIRRPLGEVVSRRILSMTETVVGTRYEAKYASSFSALAAATETVTYAKQPDGEWKPIGYEVRKARAEDCPAEREDLPRFAFAFAMAYAGTIIAGFLSDVLPVVGRGLWLAGIFFVLWYVAYLSGVMIKARAGDKFIRSLRQLGAVTAWLTSLPVIGVAIYFVFAMTQERGGWHPGAAEFILVALAWLGTVVLPVSGWHLSRGRARWIGLVSVGLLLLTAIPFTAVLAYRAAGVAKQNRAATAAETVALQGQAAQQAANAESWTNHIRLKQIIGLGRHGTSSYGDDDFKYQIVFDEQSVALTVSYRKEQGAQYRVQVEEKNGRRRALGEGGLASTSRFMEGQEVVEDKKMLSRVEFDRVAALVLQKRIAAQSIGPVSFDPVVERTLPLSDLGYSYSLDLESGEMRQLPARLTMAAWSIGITLPPGIIVAAPSTNRALTVAGTRVQVIPLLNSVQAWENPRAADLDLPYELRSGQTVSVTGESSSPPVTFAFRTEKGVRGLLQITGFTENPRCVKIRYKLVQGAEAASSPAAPAGKTNELPALTGESSKGLRLECRPIAATFATNQLVGINCRVINTTRELKPVGWSVGTGAHFCLTPKSERYFGGILPKTLLRFDGSLTVRDGYPPYSMKIVYLPPGQSVEFHLDCGYLEKPQHFEGRIVYDPMSLRNGYVSSGGHSKPPWADQLVSSENFTFEVVDGVGGTQTDAGKPSTLMAEPP